MADKKFVGSFQSEKEVLDKIDTLRVQGFSEDDMYIVTNDTDSLTMVQGRTDVDMSTTEGNWMDRFKAFMTGDEPVQAAFTNMGFSQEESDRYYNDVKRGAILLYVDRDYKHLGNDDNHTAGMVNNHAEADQNSDLTVDPSVNPLDNKMNDHRNLDAEHAQEEHLRLHEEKLNVDKESVQTGEVNVGKHVVEDHQTVEVPVSREEVTIERRAVHDEAATGEVFDDGENIHIPIMEEEVEVTKRPVVSEEIVVNKREVHDTETVSENVRREEVDIDRSGKITNDLDEIELEEEAERKRLRDNDRI